MTLSNSPDTELKANDPQYMGIADSPLLGEIATGDVDLWCCWWEPISKQRFEVRLHFPTNVFTIGSDPSWEVMSDTVDDKAATVKWVKPSSRSAPHDWTLENLSVQAVPTVGSSSLDVAVYVNDSPSGPSGS
ncbi:MAG: hypothetical protein AB7V74_16040 [Acidimicrobiia bacterium]